MFRDERRSKVWDEIRQHGIQAFAKQITPGVLAEAAKRSGVAIVKSPLNLANLAWLGIAAALHTTIDFASILTTTLRLLEDQQGFYSTNVGKAKQNAQRRQKRKPGKKGRNGKPSRSKHSPQRNDPTQVSEEAFVKARKRMPLEFWINLIMILGEQFHLQHPEQHMFRGFRLLALDGTDISLPNWRALKDHFGTATNKTGQHNAQARMVMLQFPTTRLPYRYELTPLTDGEITIARRLSQHLCKNDLVLMDAGFWSYGLFWDIQDRNAFFALRLKSGISLKRVRSLGRGDLLVRWTPKDSRGQWKKEGLPRSMELRVVSYQVPGFRTQKLVTNVLSPRRIPRADWVRLTTECERNGKFAPGLLHRRWEIETTYRELKVDQGMEGHLRGRTPASIQYEVAGHVVLYMLVRWLMVEAALTYGLDPLSLSFKHGLRELMQIYGSLVTARGSWLRTLVARLLQRIAEHQVPYRPGRHYERRKKSTNHKRKQKSQSVAKTTTASKRTTAKRHKQKLKNKG